MVRNSQIARVESFPTSEGVSKRANEWAKQSAPAKQAGWCKQIANGRASGSILTSGFLVVLDHSIFQSPLSPPFPPTHPSCPVSALLGISLRLCSFVSEGSRKDHGFFWRGHFGVDWIVRFYCFFLSIKFNQFINCKKHSLFFLVSEFVKENSTNVKEKTLISEYGHEWHWYWFW